MRPPRAFPPLTWAPQKPGAFFFGCVRCECWEQEAQRVGFAAYLAAIDAGAFKRRVRHVPGAPRQGLPVVRSCAAAKKSGAANTAPLEIRAGLTPSG